MGRRLLTAMVAATVLLAATLPAAAAVRIALRPRATLDVGQITVGSIAEVTGDDPMLVAEVGGLRIGATPWPGNARRVTRNDIAMVLVRKDISPREITWAGVEACTVSVRVTRVRGEEIAAAARACLRRLPVLRQQGVTIALRQTPRDRLLPVTGEAAALDCTADGIDRPWGKARVFVRLRSGERVHATVPVYFQITCSREVVVASRALARGAIIGADDIEMRSVTLGAAHGAESFCLDAAEVIGKKAARPLLAGVAIGRGAVAEPYAVRKGEMVSILLESDYLKITAKGVARSDARIGEAVSIEVLISGRRLMCRAVGVGEVALSL